MTPSEIAKKYREEREQMVRTQLVGRGIADQKVIEAMRTVPREIFVAEADEARAYADRPLRIGAGQTISQPYIVALMVEALKLTKSARVLEVGTGSGYGAAVLSRIACRVYTVERIAELVRGARERFRKLGYDNIEVLHGDGSRGWSAHAPYDAIVSTASGPEVPESLLNQLAPHGRLVIPVGARRGIQRLVRVTRWGPGQYREEDLGEVSFVPLVGSEGWKTDAEADDGRFRWKW